MKLFKPALFKRPLLVGLIVFILILVTTQLLTYQSYLLSKNKSQEEISEQAKLVEKELQAVLNQGFITTQTLAFMVDNYGIPDNFDSVAKLLLNTNKNIDVLELVNDKGTITHVYPLEGNEVLGLNILKDSIGKSGALETIQRKDYFVTGPIRLHQGGSGIVCRTPLFKDAKFNGFTASVIQLPSLLSAIPIDTVNKGRYSYQLSKINDDGTEEVFFSSKDISLDNAFNIPITTRKGEWKLYVIANSSSKMSSIFIFGILGFLLSTLAGIYVTFILNQPIKLKKLVEEKTTLLEVNKEKYKLLVEQASDGIFMTDFNGGIINVNPMGAQMFGYEPNEMLQKNLKDLVSKEELTKNPIKFSELKAGATLLTERKMLKKDGSAFYGEVNAKALNSKCIQGIVRDSTERKKLEVVSQNNLQKFSKAFNNTTVGMVIVDLQKGIVDANTFFLNLIGWSLDDIKGKTFTELNLIDEDSDIRKQIIKALERYGKIDTADVVFKSKKGEDLYLLGSAETYNYNESKYLLATLIDRTEAKKNQLKIIQSEAKYRELTERISDAFVAFDNDWNFTYVNAKASKLISRKPQEVMGKNLWTEFPEFAKSEAYPIFIGAFKKQKYAYLEQYFEPFDAWIANHIYPSKEGTTIYFKNITKKKKADSEKQQLISIIENSPGFIGLAGLDGKSTFLNEAGRKLVGLSPDKDLSDITIFDFFPETYKNTLVDVHVPHIQNKGSWSGEAPLKNFKTNEIIPTAFSGFIIRDKTTNKGIGIGSVAFDISERLKYEKEILELQSKMNAAIRIGEIGYWDWNVLSEIIAWSNQMYKIYDVEPGTIITVPFTQSLVHPDDWDYHNKVLNEKIANKDNSPFSYRIVHRNGDVKHVLVQMEVVEGDDKEDYRYQGTVIDITIAKEAEERLEAQNIELQKTNSELDSFVYSASHELRAPLTSILGLVNIIKIDENKPKLLEKLTMMENSIKRLDTFIKDIIEFSRNRHLELSLEKINFCNLIDDSLESLWYLENTSNINIVRDISVPVDYYSDKRRIAVILNNFISNAIKYHNTKKNNPTIWITITSTNDNAEIVVRDNGPGINKTHLSKIFDMFYRASSKIMGSGIGLYIVKEIIDKLNGSVKVDSEINKGTTFTVILPNEFLNYKKHGSEKSVTNR